MKSTIKKYQNFISDAKSGLIILLYNFDQSNNPQSYSWSNDNSACSLNIYYLTNYPRT